MNLRLITACTLLCGCGGTTATGRDAGTGSSQGPPPPDAFVNVTVGSGPETPANACGLGARVGFLAIGVPDPPRPTTAQDGQTFDGNVVHVACSVTPVGGGFDVALSVAWADANGGSFSLSSPPGMGTVTTSGASGITATFESTSLGTYREGDCTIAFTYEDGPVPVTPTVTGGRIWGHVSCPSAIAGDGSAGQCDAEADFLFEQCGQ